MSNVDLTKAGTPRKRAPGGGRKPSVVDGRRRWFLASPYHDQLIAQWQQAHGVSASQALREMIEQASKKENGS